MAAPSTASTNCSRRPRCSAGTSSHASILLPRWIILVASLLAVSACMNPLAAAWAAGGEGATLQPEATQVGAPAESETEPHGDRVVVIYFHRTLRCYTCLGMEAAAREAVYEDFLDLVSGRTLEWRAVNFDLPENAHFVEEYDLEGSSLVIMETAGERVVRWEKIKGIWNHAGHPEELRPYVGREIRRFLARQGPEDSAGDGHPGEDEVDSLGESPGRREVEP